ncbi:MAG TPA: ATP-binding protein [Steroidobacteraceae bacterium]|nr:ATP-binding protein [Steroidobacteraceae bacterium]
MSIRNRLLWSLLAAIGALWILAIAISYGDAHRELDRLFDAQLAQSAQLLSAQAGHELLELDDLEQEDLAHYAQQFAVQLWGRNGDLLLRMGSAPQTKFSQVERGFSDASIDGVGWRVYSDWDVEHQILVQMGEPHATRERLAAQIAIDGLLPLLIALPLMGILIWWIVSRGLLPIRRIGEQVARSGPLNLKSIDIETAPAEVQPLIERLNDLFSRIERSIENERRFTADAAHELRNPVAAIRAQAEAALGEPDAAAMRSGLEKILTAATRLSRLVGQLLALARLDTKAANVSLQPLDLARLARQTIADAAPAAIEHGAGVYLEASSEAWIKADAALLDALLRNLIDNALIHGGPGVQVETTIVNRDADVELSVSDNGVFVPPQTIARLGQRFFRADSPMTEGSGLGLSIVKRIAELHNAALTFDRGPDERGLRVTLRFPRSTEH